MAPRTEQAHFPLCASVRGRPVEVAADGDRRHRNQGTFGQARFQVVVLLLSFGEAQPPAVVVDNDVDVIGVVEGTLPGRLALARLAPGRDDRTEEEAEGLMVRSRVASAGRESFR
jgi:hypothetical protein